MYVSLWTLFSSTLSITLRTYDVAALLRSNLASTGRVVFSKTLIFGERTLLSGPYQLMSARHISEEANPTHQRTRVLPSMSCRWSTCINASTVTTVMVELAPFRVGDSGRSMKLAGLSTSFRTRVIVRLQYPAALPFSAFLRQAGWHVQLSPVNWSRVRCVETSPCGVALPTSLCI